MKSTVLIAAIAAGLTLVALDASAEGRGGPREKPAFAILDADGNGSITMEELENAAAARFAAMDTDGNGGISAAELATAHEAEMASRTAKMIERMDENGDGELQADEMKPRGRGNNAERMFDHMDENEDAAISQDEYDAAGEGRGGRHGGKGGRDRG